MAIIIVEQERGYVQSLMIFSFPLSLTLSVFADLLRRYQCREAPFRKKASNAYEL